MPTKRTSKPTAAPTPPQPNGKIGTMVELLRLPDGTTTAQLVEATGWQSHSVRGAMAGALKKRGFVVTSDKLDGVRTYRLPPAAEVEP